MFHWLISGGDSSAARLPHEAATHSRDACT